MAMLATMAGCVGGKPPDGSETMAPRTGNVDTIKIVPYPASPGPHPKPAMTMIFVASNHARVSAGQVHIHQGKNLNGTTNPYWVTVEVDTTETLQPVATVNNPPR